METNSLTPNPSGNSSVTSNTSDETSDNVDQSDEETWDFDEPNCRWRPRGQNDEDCGEGVICPPCG